jgi:hypothetical protein
LAETELIRVPDRKPLPDTIEVVEDSSQQGLTPNELRLVKRLSGLRLDYLVGPEADLDEKTQLGVWLALHRAGYEPTWEEAGDVRPVTVTVTPDPSSGESSKDSPDSAASGA